MDKQEMFSKLCPCEYCKKKDRIVIESKTSYWSDLIPVEFYRIRCTRLLCRFRNYFYAYSDQSCVPSKVIAKWNGRYNHTYEWKRLQ